MLIKRIWLALLFSPLIFSNSSFSCNVNIPTDIDQALAAVYAKCKNIHAGKNADYIPELAKVNPALFGIAIVTVTGEIKSIGDANIPFAIESVSKPFVYGLALQDNGEKLVTDEVGLNATGLPFNSVLAIEQRPKHTQNPMVNAGAIQVNALIKGNDSKKKWQRVLNMMQQASDGKLYLGNAVYQSEMATNQHNRAIAELLNSYGMMRSDSVDAVDRYTKACSVMVTARELAIMGATLANKGINPITHQRIFSQKIVQDILAQMVVSGLYENSGAWFWMVGIPSKSGVGGGILAVVPDKMAIVVFSPPVDESGNSVRGQQVIKDLSVRWKLHLLSE